MTTVFLAWRDPGRRWFPVGRLTRTNGHFTFAYTRGALEAAKAAGFLPLAAFPDFSKPYEAAELFPAFANRLVSNRRPDFAEFVDWLNLPADAADPLAILARSSGRRETDTFEVFACPTRDATGRYHVQCFVHGLEHRTPEAIARATRLQVEEALQIEPEPNNPVDRLALKALTIEDLQHIGYLPRYLTEDVRALGLDRVDVRVERVNPSPTPIQFRVLIRLTAPWPEAFAPCASPLFQPITRAGTGMLDRLPDESRRFLEERGYAYMPQGFAYVNEDRRKVASYAAVRDVGIATLRRWDAQATVDGAVDALLALGEGASPSVIQFFGWTDLRVDVSRAS